MTLGDIVLLAALGVATFVMRHFFQSYLTEKARNLATKEDVAELTHQVEGVKSQYQADLERLRADLNRRSDVSRAIYEAEFEAYRQIWDLLIPTQRAVLSLRPMLDSGLGPDETEESRKFKRLQEFGAVFNSFTEQVWKRKPFYAPDVHSQLQEVARLIHSEAVEYQYGRPDKDEDYWPKARANAEELNLAVDRVCEAIRNRVSGPVA